MSIERAIEPVAPQRTPPHTSRDPLAARARVGAHVRAGGEPVVLPPIERPDEANAIATRFDGLVLPGGDDLDPALHGGSAPAGDVDRMHDDADIALARAALRHGMPLLAVCRGMQVLNVALGGTLLEEVPKAPIPPPRRPPFRAVGTELRRRASHEHHRTNRFQLPPPSSGPPSVAACGSAGAPRTSCIEVLEHEVVQVLAVQWHPEDDAEHQPGEQALFDALVERSATRHYTANPQLPATKGKAR